jgi:hypothetical protein
LTCETIGQRRYYAVCLKLINEKKPSGSLQSIYSDCFAAINKRTCPALKMRKEEAAAGHALYFQERKAETLATFEPTRPARKFQPIERPVERPEVKKENDILNIDTTGFADLINKTVRNEKVEVKKPDTKPVTVTKTEPVTARPNESLLDLAKRMMAQKSS